MAHQLVSPNMLQLQKETSESAWSPCFLPCKIGIPPQALTQDEIRELFTSEPLIPTHLAPETAVHVSKHRYRQFTYRETWTGGKVLVVATFEGPADDQLENDVVTIKSARFTRNPDANATGPLVRIDIKDTNVPNFLRKPLYVIRSIHVRKEGNGVMSREFHVNKFLIALIHEVGNDLSLLFVCWASYNTTYFEAKGFQALRVRSHDVHAGYMFDVEFEGQERKAMIYVR